MSMLRINFPMSKIISYTTRPMRDGEKNHSDYHFITNEQFTKMVMNGEMFEATIFNDWCYGTGIGSLREDFINVGVFNLTGLDTLLDMEAAGEIELEAFYINASDKKRVLRQLLREQKPDVKEIVRRFGTDEIDFENIEQYNLTEMINEEHEDIVNICSAICDHFKVHHPDWPKFSK